MKGFVKAYRRCIIKASCLVIMTLFSCSLLGCTQENASETLLPYILVSKQAQQLTYGYYKCRYAHYRDGVPTSGSEDILKVPTGTVISYGSYEHVIVEGEVFDANVWFNSPSGN